MRRSKGQRWSSTLFALTAAAGALVFLHSASSSAAGDTLAAMDRSPAPISDSGAVSTAADAVKSYGAEAGSTWFTSVVADHIGNSLTVYRVPNPGFDAHVRALSRGVPVTLRAALHSRQELEAAMHAIDVADIRFVAIFPRTDGSGLDVLVSGSAASTQAELDELLPGLTTVRSGPPLGL